ncbi:MAG: histidinol-phosphate transaminase [Clostridia bacterium]|nr:histidinol-phosphate transaminase [Clostridia bacterium]
MSRFIDSRLGALEEYVPGEQPQDKKYIKLNTNEFPYPPAPQVIAAVTAAEVADLRLYSDPTCKVLKEKLAARYGAEPENVFVGNGSDEVLNFAFMAWCRGGAAFADITYGFYSVFAELYGIDAEVIPLKEDLSVDPEEYMNKGKAVVLANPNAPTGLCLPRDTIERVVKSNPGSAVIVDEAYVDFGGESATELTKKYDNLLVVGTFSKSRALAGARVGFGVGDKELIRDLEKIKYCTNPYNINRLSLVAAAAALDARAYYDEKDALVAETREKAQKELRARGFAVSESKANFIFATHEKIPGGALYEALKARGILVRHFTVPRIRDYNRITVGTPEEMKTLIDNIKEIINGLE